MKRPCLEYAALPDIPVKKMSPTEQLICKLAWVGDNAAYGVEAAVKNLIDDVRSGRIIVPTPEDADHAKLWRTHLRLLYKKHPPRVVEELINAVKKRAEGVSQPERNQ